MQFYAHEKLALMVDGPNFWHASKNLGFDIDYGKLREFFARQATLTNCIYFTRMEETDDFNALRPLVDWLEYHGWQVVTREKDTDVDLAVAAMEMADHINHFVIVSGDADYCSLVEALQRKGVRTSVLATLKSPGSNCSDDLRRAAEQFIEMDDLRATITRPARAVKEALSA